MPSRWDKLLHVKPLSLMDHLLNEVAQKLAQDLCQWPPPVEEAPEASSPFRAFFDPSSLRPDPKVYSEAFRLAQWELERANSAYDDYMRNHRWTEHGLRPEDRQALLFLSRWLLEQVLSLGEATQNRVARPQMQTCLQHAERCLRELTARRAGGG